MSSPDEPESKPTEERSWAETMRQFYYETGALRSEDLSRLLGDQSKTVYMEGPRVSQQQTSHLPLFG